MPITVFSEEWFLLEFKIATFEAYLAFEKLRRLNRAILFQLQEMYRSIASIALWRLILLALKRLGSITKNWLKENKIDEWLKAILHGAYLGAFEGLYIFLYFLHFFRAFLTIIDYFSNQDNKNLVEVTKLLYAVFKVLISLLMLAFMIVMLAHGIAFLGLTLYYNIKIFFLIYSFSKLTISFFTLGFSFIHYKKANGALDQVWLKKQYENNLKKHREILIVAVPITLLLTLLSLGLVTGPWVWVVLALASIFLIIDAAKAIYYYKKGSGVPEPLVAQLPQQNVFFHDASNNYYYRKCRIARLKNNDPEGNRIYLLKEISVKIYELQIKLKKCSSSRFIFFSEKPKIQEKIEGLKQLASTLLKDGCEENTILFNKVLNVLQKDSTEIGNNKTLISKENIKEFIGEFAGIILHEILYARDRFGNKKLVPSQLFKQSAFKNISDCGDILKAYLVYKETLESETPYLKTRSGVACA